MNDVPVLLVRLLSGVPESLRVVHIVPVNLMTPALMVAYCGMVILPSTAEPLDALTGAICERCAFNAPIPGIDALPPREVTPVSDSQAPATPPLPPEVEALLLKGRTPDAQPPAARATGRYASPWRSRGRSGRRRF